MLAGKGLDQADKGDGADIALGLSKGDPWLQDLGDPFRLDEWSLKRGDDGLEDSSRVLGKYLNPDP